MKPKQLALTVLALTVTALAVGCKPSVTQDQKNTAQQLEKVQKETEAAVRDMKDYTYAQKAAFVANMQGQITEINRDLDQIAARIEKANADAQTAAKPKLQALRDQAAMLGRQLDEAQNATELTWDDVKAGFKKGCSEIKEGVNQARQWVSDQIEP